LSYDQPVTSSQKADAFVSVNLYGSLSVHTIRPFPKILSCGCTFTLGIKARGDHQDPGGAHQVRPQRYRRRGLMARLQGVWLIRFGAPRCRRIIMPEGKINIFNLAKNAGTSVEQIERLYGRTFPLFAELAKKLHTLVTNLLFLIRALTAETSL
jgi:hypothetical protein